MRHRWKQAAIRAAVAVVPILAWQCYIWHVTHSEEYQHPVYPYQRAAYYYPNVTYSENSSLKDPFQPELGRTKRPTCARELRATLLAIPVALGEAAGSGVRCPAISTAQAFSCDSGLATGCPPWRDICLFAVGLGALAGAVLIAGGTSGSSRSTSA